MILASLWAFIIFVSFLTSFAPPQLFDFLSCLCTLRFCVWNFYWSWASSFQWSRSRTQIFRQSDCEPII